MQILENKIVVIGALSLLILIVIGLSTYIFVVSDFASDELCEVNSNTISLAEEVSTTAAETIYIEIKGAIMNPGVYEMPLDSIINDAILAAGGFREDAYTDNINLSKRLTDELVIYIYTKSEYQNKDEDDSKTTSTSSNASYYIDSYTDSYISIISDEASATTTESGIININTAGVSELMTLPGIGEAKANNIVAYRNENGNFKNIEEIKNVSGIGDAIFAQLKDYITV